MKKIGFLVIMVITVMFYSYSFVNASERYDLQGYKLTLLEYSNKKDMSTAYRELSKKYTVAKDEDIELEEALI